MWTIIGTPIFMETILREYLALEKGITSIKLHHLNDPIEKWCHRVSKHFVGIVDYSIEEDLSFSVRYSTGTFGNWSEDNFTDIPKEYFLAADKDKFITDYLVEQRVKEAEKARIEAEKRLAEQDRSDLELYKRLKTKFEGV